VSWVSPREVQTIVASTRLPDFRCGDVDGTERTPADLMGTGGLLVLFLSATCPFVLAQEDRLLELARRFIPAGLGVVAICSNSDASLAPGNTIEDVGRHARDRGYPFPYLYDADQSLATAFGAQCTPDIFLYDADGERRYHGRLDDSWRDPAKVTERHLEGAILALLDGREPDGAQPPPFGCAIKWVSGPQEELTGELVASGHLRVMGHPNGLRVVNVLNGTMIECGPDLITFLDAFRIPTTLQEVGGRLGLPTDASAIAEHLVAIGFLVRPGTDELAPLRDRVAGREKRVESGSLLSILRLNIATGCNLRCTYCYMEAPSVNRPKVGSGSPMPKEIARTAVEAFFRNAAANGRRHVSIRYIGGEPLLNLKVLRFAIELAEQRGKESGISVTHLVCTNGLLMTEGFAGFLKEMDDAHVLISLDGVKEHNDAFRVDTHGRGTYDRVVASLKLLTDLSVPLGVPAVITADGLSDVEPFLREMAGLGVTRVGLNPPYRFGGVEPSDAELDEWVDGFVDARTVAQSLGLELSGKAYLPEWHALHGHIANCEAMGRAIVVDPNGAVSLCDKLGESLGHVDDLPAVFRTETYRQFAMRVRGNIRSCEGCEVQWLCNGGCLAEARASYGCDDLSGSHCEFIRKMAARTLIPVADFASRQGTSPVEVRRAPEA